MKVSPGFAYPVFNDGRKTASYRSLIFEVPYDLCDDFCHFIGFSGFRGGDSVPRRKHFSGFHVDHSALDSGAAHIYSKYVHQLGEFLQSNKKRSARLAGLRFNVRDQPAFWTTSKTLLPSHLRVFEGYLRIRA